MPVDNVFLDASDIQHLIERFSLGELRHEARQAEIHRSVSQNYGEDCEAAYFEDYKASCQLAAYILRAQQPKPQPVKGKLNIEAIKARSDIVSTIERYCQLRKVGGRYSGCCPIHGDKHPSLTVYPDSQSWHCFGCNRGGDVFDFIQAVETTDFKGAANVLG